MYRYKYNRSNRFRSGYTLPELLVSIVIAGILASLVISIFFGVLNKARFVADVSEMSRLIRNEQYQDANNKWESIMLDMLDRNGDRKLSNLEFTRIPCDKLRKLDAPWSAVQGGMVRQYSIFYEIFNRLNNKGLISGKNYITEFFLRLGWQDSKDNSSLLYQFSHLGGSAEVPPGNLPRHLLVEDSKNWHPDIRLFQCKML
ncbi:GUN4 domain-containing protein [filamentous cyanobacterium LEGE 11480]|uniref:GUN4 domain-containing protein n=1 Tax=Romeriopsis navalis LEGE 11480 TaxID=2777977 RepID=A0A928VTA0_9CYAN|nr:GUN4 domain-containing protein [Romeriopsis navalis]MBE9033308.1 GUN4 domain-containing protein [Romeriopsis navalis LEGE 11480]